MNNIKTENSNLCDSLKRLAVRYGRRRNTSMLTLKYWLGNSINTILGVTGDTSMERALDKRDVLDEFSVRVGHPTWMIRSAMIMAYDLTPAKFNSSLANSVVSFSTVLRMFNPKIPAMWRRKIREEIAQLHTPCFTTYRRIMNDTLAEAVSRGDMTAAEATMIMGGNGNTMVGTVSRSARPKLHRVAHNSNTSTTELVGELVMAWEPLFDRLATMSKIGRRNLLKRVMRSTAAM